MIGWPAGLCRVVLAGLGPLLASATFAADIYIDPSRTGGCPGQGTLEAPYCSWNDVGPLAGGNRYLQRRGTVWSGGVRVTAIPGVPVPASAAEVFIGAYGDGDTRPIIRVDNSLPGSRDSANWRLVGPDLWAYRTAGFRLPDPHVLLLDGRRAFGPAQLPGDLCTRRGSQRVEWLHKGDELLLCSPQGNPAEVFQRISGMQAQRGSDPWVPVYIEGRRNVVIDGLALEGGGWGAVEIRAGSADVEIRNCAIGRDSASGIRIFSDSMMISGIDVHNNVIDSGIRWGAVGYTPGVSGEGVHFIAGVRDSRVHANEIVAWPHNGIYLDAHRPGDPGVIDNRIDHNDIHCGPSSSYVDYCRPVGIDGSRPGAASGNLIFANRLHDFSVGAQVNGDRNAVVGNFCYNVVNSGARGSPTGMCFRLQAYVFSRDNLIAFNTIANTADAAVELRSGDGGITAGHRVIGNLFYGCGHDAVPERRDVCIVVGAAPEVGPAVIEDNLFFNPGGRAVRMLYRNPRAVEAQYWQAVAGDRLSGNRVANPLFLDAPAGDFDLAAASPARRDVPVLEVSGLAGQPLALGAWQGGPPGEGAWRLAP